MKRWSIVAVFLIVILIIGLFIYSTNHRSFSPSNAIMTPGVTTSEIVIGAVSAQTGPTAFLGTEYLRGAQTYINTINDAGGVYGRKIRLVSYDDQYDPPKTAYYTQKVILQDKAFALLNFVGTATGKKILPLINDAKIPLVGLFSGAQLFRDPLQPYVFNIRASYYQEASAIVKDLVERQKLTKIAVLYQYDDFGFDGLKGVEIALAQHNMRPIVTAPYERNTDKIETALATIKATSPEAVILVAVYNPAVKFISLAKTSNFNPIFATMSFVGPEAFAKGLAKDAEGIIVSQTIPPPHKEILSDCPDDYTARLQKYFPDAIPTFGGLEGFINAKILVEGLHRAGPILTRDSFIAALESLNNYSIAKNSTLTFTKNDHQGFDKIYLSQIKNGAYQLIGDDTPSENCIQAQ